TAHDRISPLHPSGAFITMKSSFIQKGVASRAAVLLAGVLLGLMARELIVPIRGDTGDREKPDRPASEPRGGSYLAPRTAAPHAPDWERPYPQYQPVGQVLKPYPHL